jgi:hypothetical protein
MTSYNWNVSQTDYEIENGFITTAHWTCLAADEDYSASIYATSSWCSGTPSIPYEQVTMTEVLDWIWANGVSKQDTEDNLAANIALQKNPVIAAGVPW